jgi:2,4-dienoyl-CoA reductase-like NADH-dependent reductase (Old Yellow Enzyme family)
MKLFEPLTIRNMTLKNRLVLPALHLGLGVKGKRATAFYLERARGGVGAVTMAGTPVDLLVEDEAWGRPGGVEQFVDVMQPFTDEIRETGARIGIQLWHGNQLPAGNGRYNKAAAQVAPSAAERLREITTEEIQTVITRFAAAAAQAQKAGLDFVELHGAHGYLLCQFFSPLNNHCQDKYGGSLIGRMQFGIEVAKAVRQAVGDDYPIFYRLGAVEYLPGGIVLEESRQFAVELEKAGVDVINVSLGSSVGLGASPTQKSEMGTFVPLAEAIKQKVTIPVIAVGRINTGEVAESVLAENCSDLVAVGRQLIADPFWPEKVQQQRETEIVKCISCNRCFGPIRNRKWRPGDRICKVNDRAGREIDLPVS